MMNNQKLRNEQFLRVKHIGPMGLAWVRYTNDITNETVEEILLFDDLTIFHEEPYPRYNDIFVIPDVVMCKNGEPYIHRLYNRQSMPSIKRENGKIIKRPRNDWRSKDKVFIRYHQFEKDFYPIARFKTEQNEFAWNAASCAADWLDRSFLRRVKT